MAQDLAPGSELNTFIGAKKPRTKLDLVKDTGEVIYDAAVHRVAIDGAKQIAGGATSLWRLVAPRKPSEPAQPAGEAPPAVTDEAAAAAAVLANYWRERSLV